MSAPLVIGSRENALAVRLRRLSADKGGYRRLGELWLEGEHLCNACLRSGHSVLQAVISETAWAGPLSSLAEAAPKVAVLSDAVFAGISDLASPAGLGFVVAAPAPPVLQAGRASLVLDRLQDPGNVGSILRSAAALGVQQVIALEGTAGLWSQKVLRAAMGAHFSLRLLEGVGLDALDALALPLLATSSHAARSIFEGTLPSPCAWVFGHEGQGIDRAVMARCAQQLRIPQPGGEESLNVAAAAAICCYESLRQRHATTP